jgi:hypothetical protein
MFDQAHWQEEIIFSGWIHHIALAWIWRSSGLRKGKAISLRIWFILWIPTGVQIQFQHVMRGVALRMLDSLAGSELAARNEDMNKCYIECRTEQTSK